MDSLQKQLVELKKRRQEIIQKRNAELEAIKELAVAPEPQSKIEQSPMKKSKDKYLSIERPNDQDVDLTPVQHTFYTRSIQADLIAEAPIVEKSSTVHLAIDDNSQNYFDYITDDVSNQNQDPSTILNFGPTSEYQIVWSSSPDNRKFPSAIDWCDTSPSFAVAVRNFSLQGEGVVSIHHANSPQNSIELKIPAPPTTVKFIPRTADQVLVGTLSGLLFLYDKRTSNESPVYQTQRWSSCHYSQIISTIFTGNRRFISLDADGSIFTWDLDSFGSCLSKDFLPNSKSQMIRPTCADTNDLGKVIIGFEDGRVAAYSHSVNKELELDEICHNSGSITGLSFRQSSRGFRSALAVSSIDCTLSIFSGEKKTKEIQLINESFLDCKWRPSSSQNSLTAAPPVLCALTSDKKAVLYDIAHDDERSFELPAMGCCTSFSTDGNMLCVGCIDGSYHLINCP